MSAPATKTPPANSAPSALLESVFSSRARRTNDPPISWMMKLVIDDPEIISLAAGFVDQPTLPDQSIVRVMKEVFADAASGKAALQYGGTQGLPRLRELVAKRLEKTGLRAPISPENICITNGSQQTLHLVCDTLVDPGDIVIVADPTYFVFLGVLEAVGARVVGVKTDEDEMIPEELEATFKRLDREGLLPRVKVVYVQSYFQNPMGVSLGKDRRKQIVDIVGKWGGHDGRIVLLEDAAYRELRMEGDDLPYLKTFDPENRWIATTGTFSKGYAPGLRLGWGYIPTPLYTAMMRQKGNQDFGSSNLAQNICAKALELSEFDKQNELLRDRYRAKRDVTIKAIREFFPDEVRYVTPKGGLYVWTTLPENISTNPDSQFFKECLKRKVIYVPGYFCYGQEPGVNKPTNKARICYGYIEEGPTIEGVKRMGEAIKAVLRK